MNNILVTHLSASTGKMVGSPFVANLEKYKEVNKDNGFNWDQALTAFINNESYTTINQPYCNIKLELTNIVLPL